MKYAPQKPFFKIFPPIPSEWNGLAPAPILKKGFCFARGFSLIEITISVALLALVISAGWFSFSSYAARRELDSGVARVAALVSEARSKTLAGENDSAYGVHFELDRAVLFRAPTYQAGSTDNKTEILPSRIIISSINFSNSEAVFKRLTGAALGAGSLTLSLRGDLSVSRTISINALGTIENE